MIRFIQATTRPCAPPPAPFIPALSLALCAVFAASSGSACDRDHVRPQGEVVSVAAGVVQVLSAQVDGQFKRARWEIVEAHPSTCRGRITEQPAEGGTVARFLAPSDCAGENRLAVIATFGGLFGGDTRREAHVLVQLPGPSTGGSPLPADAMAAPPPAPESAAAGVRDDVIPAFGGESYFDFKADGFRADHVRTATALQVRLAAPGGGFGGTCIVRRDGPLDVRSPRYKTLHVDLESDAPQHRFEIKLERTDAKDQYQVFDDVLPRPGRQTLVFDLARVPPVVLGSLRHVCFSTNSTKFAGAPRINNLQIYRVRFQ